MKKIFFLIVIVLIIANNAIEGGVGTTALPFLKIGVGAKPVALGESYVAVADDSNAVYWNPAGLGFQTIAQVNFSHLSSWQDTNYEFLSMAMPVWKKGNIGFSLAYFSHGTIAGWDEYGNSTKEFSAGDILAGISVGQKLSNKFGIGTTLKLINSWISDYSAAALACDVGSLWKLSNSFSAGLNVQNIGFNKLRFNNEGDSLPLNFKIGIAYKHGDSLLFPVDLNIPANSPVNFGIGGEYTIKSSFDFSLRTGYKTSSLLRTDWFTAGIGIGYSSYNLDYVFIPAGELGFTHRVSLSIKLFSEEDITQIAGY